MSTTVKPTVKTTITRAWVDIDPKIAAAFLSGGVASAVLIALHFAGIGVPSTVEVLISVACTVIGGYLKASTHKGDLLAKLRTDGLKDAETLAPLVAAAVPAAAAPIRTVEDIVTALAPETAPVDPAAAIDPTVAIPTQPGLPAPLPAPAQ